MNPAASFRCDIFCRVVDNFGDAGVCWRLARQFALEFGVEVRLLIDDRQRLLALAPEAIDRTPTQGVSVLTWQHAAALHPADFVIEAFACELPPAYLEAMALRQQPPVWVNLEYLSAEEWVAGHHLLPSPHPRLPLTKYFFFPGFSAGTGGLIRERSLAEAPAEAPPAPGAAPRIFMFGYANPALPGLLETWRDAATPPVVGVVEGALASAAAAWLVEQDGARRLPLSVLKFVPQSEFDARLAGHDLLFVRGEDSFVRAQWAARPLVWHIYPQEGGAHWRKLNAFLERYCVGLAPVPAQALRALWTAWNEQDPAAVRRAWRGFEDCLPELRRHARHWAATLMKMPDLATNLVIFYRKTVKM